VLCLLCSVFGIPVFALLLIGLTVSIWHYKIRVALLRADSRNLSTFVNFHALDGKILSSLVKISRFGKFPEESGNFGLAPMDAALHL
jgi:hypothetical protein